MLCIVLAIYDANIFSLPYMVLPGIYIELWVHGYPDATKRHVDRVAAHWALVDLMITYLSFVPPTGDLLRSGLTQLNLLSWLDSPTPRWNYTACLLKLLLIGGNSTRGLFEFASDDSDGKRERGGGSVSKGKLSTAIDNSKRRVTQMLTDLDGSDKAGADSEARVEEKVNVVVNWAFGLLLEVAYVICLTVWSVVGITPTCGDF